jgi:hypothetical protein
MRSPTRVISPSTTTPPSIIVYVILSFHNTMFGSARPKTQLIVRIIWVERIANC